MYFETAGRCPISPSGLPQWLQSVEPRDQPWSMEQQRLCSWLLPCHLGTES